MEVYYIALGDGINTATKAERMSFPLIKTKKQRNKRKEVENLVL